MGKHDDDNEANAAFHMPTQNDAYIPNRCFATGTNNCAFLVEHKQTCYRESRTISSIDSINDDGLIKHHLVCRPAILSLAMVL